ncbi:MAG: flagellar biosynthesis protein FlgI, partial [Sulfitobacter sp. SK025]
ISNRNELDGNYGKLGQKMSGQSGNNMRVDQKY